MKTLPSPAAARGTALTNQVAMPLGTPFVRQLVHKRKWRCKHKSNRRRASHDEVDDGDVRQQPRHIPGQERENIGEGR